MQVGQIAEDHTSFDIHSLDETDTVLQKRNGRNTLIFKDEKSRIHVLDRTVQVPTITLQGTLIEAFGAGVACPVLDPTIKVSTVGKTLTEINWDDLSNFKTKQIAIDGVEYTAALVPVFLRL